MTQVLDKHGKRITRSGGILQDGDTLVVRMQMMDAADPRLVAAAALADAVKRNEKFDYAMQGHRPGYGTVDAATSDTVDKAFADRNSRLTNAWKNPPAVVADGSTIEKPALVTGTTDEQRAAADRAIEQRDKRTSEAWRS